MIKYIDFSVDSRTSDVWKVTFRQVINDNDVEKEFRLSEYPNFKEEIYKWLKE